MGSSLLQKIEKRIWAAFGYNTELKNIEVLFLQDLVILIAECEETKGVVRYVN